MEKSNAYRKPSDAWNVTQDGIKLKYPILHHDLSIPHDPIIKSSIEEVIGDIDFWGWKENDDVRIIDSAGKTFFAGFEEQERKILSIVSLKKQSGVFPGKLDRIMELSELKTIMISGIEHNRTRIKEDIDELKLKIASMNSIEHVLKTCSKYF